MDLSSRIVLMPSPAVTAASRVRLFKKGAAPGPDPRRAKISNAGENFENTFGFLCTESHKINLGFSMPPGFDPCMHGRVDSIGQQIRRSYLYITLLST